MRALRFGIGLILIVVAVWIIVGEQITGASANAFINARLTTLRSPIAGQVSFEQDTLGARLQQGEAIARVADDRSDDIREKDISLEVALESAEIARLEKQLSANSSFRTGFEERLSAYRAARIRDLEIERDHAQARLDLLRTDAPTEEEQQVAEVVDEDSQRTRGEPVTNALAIDYAQQRLEEVENALAAAREDDVFLGDGYNDAPNAEQRLNDLEQEEMDLRTSLQKARARRSAFKTRLDQARVRGTSMSSATLEAPIDGLLWEFRSAEGEIVQRGDPVATLADCETVLVSLSVTESVYNTLRLGQAARFRPSGSSRTFEGTVSRLAGSGAETIYRNFAVAPSQRHLERYDVTLLVPALEGHPDYGCAIGRTGRVFFDARPLDWLRNLGS